MAQIPCVVDTCSVDLEINAENKLQADVILDPDGGLVCTPGSGVGLNLGTAGCGIDADLGGGALNLNLDYDTGRGLDCDGSGLFVRNSPNACNSIFFDAGQLRVNEHGSRLLTGGSATGAPGIVGVTTTFLGVVVDLDAFFGAYGFAAVEVSTRASVSFTNTFCRTMNFIFGYAIVPRFVAANGWTVYMGCRQEIVSPAVTGVVAPFTEFNHSGAPFNPGTYHGLSFPPQSYEEQSFLLPGQNATVTTSCILQVATPGGGSAVPNVVEFRFGAGARLYLWTRD